MSPRGSIDLNQLFFRLAVLKAAQFIDYLKKPLDHKCDKNHFSHPFLGTCKVHQFLDLGYLEGTPFQGGI